MADYLEELLKDTPMGRIKLLAAWDSLSTETQIRLLAEMITKGRTQASDRPVWLKALSSPSEYIRYLAAKEMRFARDDEIRDKIMSDASQLVQSSRDIFIGQIFSGKDFDRSPKERKLAAVSDEDPPPAEKLARWVKHAVETKSVSDDEIYEVVLEYLSNPEALRRLQESSSGFVVNEGRDAGFKALWGLLPTVPSAVAECLVRRLPWSGVYELEPPQGVLTWLKTSPLLEPLLWRDDAPLLELRRELFFSNDPSYDGVKPAAVWNNFYLSPGELHDLFKQNSKLLRTLAMFSRSLSPVILLALKDSVWKRGGEGGVTWDDVRLGCEKHFESAIARLRDGKLDSPYRRDQEIRFLRVYGLVKRVMSWNDTEPDPDALPEPLKFLGDKVVKGDTWGTFLAFAHETANGRFDHALPRLEDLDLAEASATGATEAKGVGDVPDQQGLIRATIPRTPSSLAQERKMLGSVVTILGIVAALLTILFALGGIIDNPYRNFGPGVIAMAISAGAIVFAGSQFRRK